MEKGNYVVKNTDENVKAFLIAMYANPSVSNTKARQLAYYQTPLTLTRWARYLTPLQCEKYLVKYEPNHTKEDSNDFGI